MSDASQDLARIHPDLPGEATVFEIFRFVWPFSRSVRRWLVLLLPLVLVLFGLTAVLPLLAGEGLQRAVSSGQRQEQVDEYRQQVLALAAASARLAGEDTALSIPTEVVMARLPIAELTLDAVFDGADTVEVSSEFWDDVRAEIADEIEAGNVRPRLGELVDRLASDPLVYRSDLAFLVNLRLLDDAPLASTSEALESLTFVERATVFDTMLGTLANDPRLVAERSQSSKAGLVEIIVLFLAVLAVIVVVQLIATAIALFMTSVATQSMQAAVFAQIHDTPLVESGAVGRPSMISRCGSYVEAIEKAVRLALLTGVPALANLVLSLVFLTWIAPSIGLAMATVVLVLEVVRRWRSAVWSSRSRERLDRSTTLNELVDFSISEKSGLRPIGAVPLLRRRFGRMAAHVAESRRQVDSTGERLEVAALAVGQLGVIAVIAVVGLVGGGLDLAQATAAVLYVGLVADSLLEMPSLAAELQDAAPYARRLRRVLLAPPTRPEPVAPIDVNVADALARQAQSGDPMVSLRGVHAVLPGRRQGVEQCSFDVAAGSWTVVVGPQGAGSSTVVELLSGWLPPASGQVSIAGMDVSRWSGAIFQQMIASIPADPAEFPGTIREHIDPAAAGSPPSSDEVLMAALGECVLASTRLAMPDGLDTVIGLDDRPLSRELRIGLAVTRARLHAGPVVVVSDPTRALDADAAADVWALMRRMFAGRTVIAATQRLDMIADDDQIIMLRNGSVSEQGHRAQLLAAGGSFARWWSGSKAGGGIDWHDLPGLRNLDDDAVDALTARVVTERVEAGQVIVAADQPAERLFVVTNGSVELLAKDGRRLAMCGPGDSFGDLDPEGPSYVTATARAVEPVVLMSLHKSAISSGAAGVLDKPPEQRLLYSWLARHGAATRSDLEGADGPGPAAIAELEAMLADHTLLAEAGDEVRYRVAGGHRRRRSSPLLDSLFDN